MPADCGGTDDISSNATANTANADADAAPLLIRRDTAPLFCVVPVIADTSLVRFPQIDAFSVGVISIYVLWAAKAVKDV